jgi:cystathionine beta-lyase
MYAQTTGYRKCDGYVDGLCAYIRGNMNYIREFLSANIPEIRFSAPQGTYLAWMDASGLNVSAGRLQDALVHVGHVGIMNGAAYGDDRYLRMCVACPRSKLEEGLRGLLAGVQSL